MRGLGAALCLCLSSALYFEQKQDHFDEQNKNRWMQAYYMNDQYWAGPDSGAPIFLSVGGEFGIGPDSVTGNYEGFVVDWLPTTKALFLAVEHRYYGCHNASACPYDASTENHLQFLSSHQALADLAGFRAFATEHYGLAPDSKWVIFGGSYSGMIAAWARAVYPEQFHCAVASSAPVIAKLDAVDFQDVITAAYALDVEGIRGSPECSEAIASGHRTVGELLSTSQGRQQLAELFAEVRSAEWLEDPTNQRRFAGCGVATFPAQGNDPTCTRPACGISQICEIMVNETLGMPLQRLAAVRKAQGFNSCPDMDWHFENELGGENYWDYQTCTEFGFYQTCEKGTKCFYTQGLESFNSQYHKPNDFCARFGLSTNDTVAGIARTNAYYGTKVEAATRIIWVNGNVDPWSGLSHLESPGKDQPVIYPVEGAAHHVWTHFARENDQQSVKDARKQIYKQVSEWLEVGLETFV